VICLFKIASFCEFILLFRKIYIRVVVKFPNEYICASDLRQSNSRHNFASAKSTSAPPGRVAHIHHERTFSSRSTINDKVVKCNSSSSTYDELQSQHTVLKNSVKRTVRRLVDIFFRKKSCIIYTQKYPSTFVPFQRYVSIHRLTKS
jgi:hypothetical protein